MGQAASSAADAADPVEEIIASFTPRGSTGGIDTEPHVFISHAGEQKMSVVDVLRARLKEKHPELDVFVDEWSLQGGDRPMARIGAACMWSAVGLVLLSPEFVRKKYCIAELRILLQRCSGQQTESGSQQPHDQQGHPGEQQLPEVQLLPVLYGLTFADLYGIRALYDSQPWCVKEPKPAAGVLDAWAADVQAVAELTLIREDQWRGDSELVELVVGRMVKLLEAAGKLPGALSTLEVRCTVPPPEAVELVGREVELEQALEVLKAGRYVEIVGGPGEGKTFLVQRLVANMCEGWCQQPAPKEGGRVAHALEVDLDLEGLRDDGLRNGKDLKNIVASKLLAQVHKTAQKDHWQVLQDWLRQQAPAPVLIAFENAEQCVALPLQGGVATEPLVQAFEGLIDQLSRLEHVHLVVATRVRTPGLPPLLPAGSIMLLEPLSNADGLRLVESRLGAVHQWSADGTDREAAEQLVQLVEGNPLALAVAAGLVKRGSRLWQDVLRGAQQGAANISGSRLDPGMKPHMAALTRWLAEFLEEPEQLLLATVCVFPSSFTAPGVAAVTPAADKLTITETLRVLVDMSLLRQRTVTAISDLQPDLTDVRYSMHALVRGAASASSLAATDRRRLLTCWAFLDSDGPGQMLGSCAPTGTAPDMARRLYLLREELQTFIVGGTGLEVTWPEGGSCKVPPVLLAAVHVGRFLGECGESLAAKLLHQAAHDIFLKVLGPEHPATLGSKVDLATGLQAVGDLGGARQLQEEVLGAATRLLGPEHLDTIGSKGGLAKTLRAMGQLGDARRLQKDMLEAFTRLLGGDHHATLLSKQDLANTLQLMGELAGARQLLEGVLEARGRLLGGEHPDTLGAKHDLAITLRAMGELQGARQVQEEVLGAATRLLGVEHPDTLLSKNNLANTLRAMGDLGRSRQLQEEVLHAFTRLLGGVHPDTLRSKSGLASTLQAMGELEGARKGHEEVLGARTRLLGLEHPDALSSKSNLASTLCAMGDLGGARQLQEEVLGARARMLGEEHPDTLKSQANLASTLQAMGELGGARQLLQEVLEARVRVLGPEHPDTLATKSALGDLGQL